MRGLVALYAVMCAEEGTTSNSELLKTFRKMDMADEEGEEGAESEGTAVVASACNHDDTKSSVAARARARAHAAAAFPITLTIGSPANYLGDAGTAAVVRMLPYMRWVRVVEARGVGAGPRTAAALCSVLDLTERITIDKGSRDGNCNANSKGDPVQMVASVVVPAVPIERVDLADNALYALSAKQLLASIRRRAALSAHASNVLAEYRKRGGPTTAGIAVAYVRVPPPVELLLDFHNIPLTTAAQLRAYHQAGDDAVQRAEEAAQARQLALRQSLFLSPSIPAAAEASVIYRIPTMFPPLPREATVWEEHDKAEDGEKLNVKNSRIPFYDPSNPSAAAIVMEVNMHMEAYLLAHRCVTARDHLWQADYGHAQQTQQPLQETTVGTTAYVKSVAAAQLCVDLGGDILQHLPNTWAAVWLTLDLEHADTDGELTEPRIALQREELLFSVGRLLRGLIRNPFIEEELLAHAEASSSSSADVLRHYLHRMKELYYQLTASVSLDTPHRTGGYGGSWGRKGHSVSQSDEEAVLELQGLYMRVASALVTGPFEETRLPSMIATEQHITALRRYLVDYMLDGTALPRASPVRVHGATPLQEARRSWPLLCAAAKYFRGNYPKESDRWNAHYLAGGGRYVEAKAVSASGIAKATATAAIATQGGSPDNAGLLVANPPVYGKDANDVPAFFLQPLTPCSCHTTISATSIAVGCERIGMQGTKPCPACCSAALSVLYRLLSDTYVHRREALVAPARLYLPMEVRLFLLEWILLQQQHLQHRQHQQRDDGGDKKHKWLGGGYMPAMFGRPSSLEAFTNAASGTEAVAAQSLFVSPVDIFAYMDADRQRLIEFCDSFAEWYRLKAIESYDSTQTSSCV